MAPDGSRRPRQAHRATCRPTARRLCIFACLVVGLVIGTVGHAPRAAEPSAKDTADARDIKRIEAYLNSVETVSARFLQISSDGSYAEGDFYLARPGRLRMAYDDPVPYLIVADGSFLIYHDRKLDQVSYLGLGSTPAGILLDEDLSLSADLKTAKSVVVTGLRRAPGVLRLQVVQKDDPTAGHFTLVFGDRPLTLRKWIVEDAQGITTTVSLMGARFGVPLNPELFRFKAPEREITTP